MGGHGQNRATPGRRWPENRVDHPDEVLPLESAELLQEHGELPVQPLSSVPELLTTLALGFFGFLHQFRRQVQRQAADPLRPFGGAGQRVER